jgi:hypothetical protein
LPLQAVFPGGIAAACFFLLLLRRVVLRLISGFVRVRHIGTSLNDIPLFYRK